MLQVLESRWLKCKMVKQAWRTNWTVVEQLCITLSEDLNKWVWWVNTLWVKTTLKHQLRHSQWQWNQTRCTSKDQSWDKDHPNPWWWAEAAPWRHKWCNKLQCRIYRRVRNRRNGNDSTTIWPTRTDRTCWLTRSLPFTCTEWAIASTRTTTRPCWPMSSSSESV